jgi:putative SOS response-associated peptidase YedK
MCGRIALYSEPERIARLLDAQLAPDVPATDADGWEPRWNVSPTDPILGVRAHGGVREVEQFRWGLIPPKTPEAVARQKYRSTFNARADKLTSNNLWSSPFSNQRLLIPVDGFFEWRALQPGEKKKQPYLFTRRDDRPLVLAGLWQAWPVGRDLRYSATVITTTAGPDMPIHDRQTIVLECDQWERWLQPDVEIEELLAMVLPGAGQLKARPISKDTTAWGTDEAFDVQPLEGPPTLWSASA